MFLGVFFCCVKVPYTLQLVIIKHLISHIIKNYKHDFLMSELSKIIKSSNHQQIYHLPTLDTFFCFHSIPLGNGKNLGFRQNALRPNKNTLNAQNPCTPNTDPF